MSDAGTAALINQLMNPPNPFETAGRAVQGANALRQYQADAAAAQAYKASIDPVTGQADPAKFNAIASQGPAAWKFGEQMRQFGVGQQAQGLGTSAVLQSKLDEQGAIASYLQPLTQSVINGGKVTGQQVSDLLATMPPGLIPPARMSQMQAQLDKIGPTGDATNFTLGAAYANQHAMEVTQRMMPNYGTIHRGSDILPVQTNPRAAGGTTYPTGAMPVTPTPGEAIQVQQRMGGIVEGGWTHPVTKEHREGTLYEYYQDHPEAPQAPGIGTLRPGPDGTFSFPSAVPGEAPIKVTPAPSAAPGPRPPRAGMPSEPSGYMTPPPGTPGAGRVGGSTVPSPRVVAAGEDAYNAMAADMPAVQNRLFTIRQAQAALRGAKTGPGTETLQALNGVLGTWTPEWAKKFAGIDPERKAANHDEATKYLQQLANANMPGGGGTNDKLAAAVTANPSTKIQQLAAGEVLDVMAAGQEMQQHVFKLAQKQKIAPADYARFAADWAANHDPRAFILQYLPKSKLEPLAKEVNSGSPSGKQLQATINELVADGVIPDPTKPRAGAR